MAITKPNKRLVDGQVPYASDFNPVFEAVDALCDAVNNQQSPADKQDVLVPGVNIKTINGQSILGGGNINLQKQIAFVEESELESLDPSLLNDGDIIFGLEAIEESVSASYDNGTLTLDGTYEDGVLTIQGTYESTTQTLTI